MRARVLACAAAALLGGCQSLGLTSGGTGDAPNVARPLVQCPNVGTPADTGDVVRFSSPDSRDLTDLVIAARITALNGSCTLVNRETAVQVTMTMAVEATRGPAAPGRTVQIPYFVAVTKGNQEILDKAVYALTAEFPANTQRVRMRGEEVRLTLPVSADQPAGAYTVYVGFQLTEPELALNRSRAGLR
ncbi:hypothetical protein [Elioraea rosea]|uniref:hypothetical protein n=1 Tax=Elioraea rosea TaxID=2492390 RepID=UPI001186E721|nr:hypothetical protein [Elioraea rosea]